MILRDRERLIARIRQLRRTRAEAEERAPASTAPASTAPATTGRGDTTRFDALEARIEHLEQLVEGLQDSVHRESARQGTQIAELQAQVQPDAMGAALDRDARDRGL